VDPGDRVLVELVPTGATLNFASFVYHNVTHDGMVKQIDCQCRAGGSGVALSSYSCYSTYIDVGSGDQNLAPNPYITITNTISATQLECFVPYFNIPSTLTSL
jgi:hypothetical protein